VAVVEPGRSIAAEAGITLYTVGQIKDIKGLRKYVSVDGGMGDNIRVALYQAEYTGVIANKAEEAKDDKVTVCGKCCESGDIILTDFMVPKSVERGDILATYSTGAYGYSMASNYNNNPIPGVVLVREGKSDWMVKPQTYEQIVQNNVIPDII
jgi:diaminopimelate decarboxylase